MDQNNDEQWSNGSHMARVGNPVLDLWPRLGATTVDLLELLSRNPPCQYANGHSTQQ